MQLNNIALITHAHVFFYGEVGGDGHFTLQGKVFQGADRPP